jgi:hypothetical protein
MAVYKIFPTKDATIYSAYSDLNTGLDEILEASTNFKTGSRDIPTIGDYPQTSRFLLQFADSEISYVSQSLIGANSWKSYLRVFVANSSGLNTNTTVIANAISQSWYMGTGRFDNIPGNTNGVSWKWADYSGSTPWVTSATASGTEVYYSGSNSGGGVWWTGSAASQSFEYWDDLDLLLDVTNIVTKWNDNSWENYGFIIRQSASQEFIYNINQQAQLSYYSRDTHTIYPPCLEFRWDDSSYNTGSLTVINTLPATLTLAENPGVFYPESVNKFYVNATPEYPIRVWQTSSWYTTNYALPENSYYAIKDLDTNEFVIDFDDNYTKLSCDASGSFFTLYMNGLEPERYYTVLIKTTINGSTIVFDDNYNFKVING